METWRNYIASSILAGIFISISCIVFVKTGGVVGAVLFAFGLITVVHYKFKLYTGTAGFINTRPEVAKLLLILAGNIVGCFVSALAIRYAEPDFADATISIVDKRMGLSPLRCGVMGIGCGFIMTAAVQFARKNQWLPLVFGVPVFILGGFLHSIADAFYVSAVPVDYISENPSLITRWIMVIVGNFIGCNFVRALSLKKNP